MNFIMSIGVSIESTCSQQFEDYEISVFDILSIGQKYGLSLQLKQQKGRQIYRYFNIIDAICGLETGIDDKKLIVQVNARKNEEELTIPYIFRNIDKGNEFVEKMIEMLISEHNNV